MANEDFVTFEQAKRLKALGFKEPCFRHYVDLDGMDKENSTLNGEICTPIGNSLCTGGKCYPILY